MFAQLIRELNRMQGPIQLTTSVEIDDKGYLDRSCPSDECGERFKVAFEEWQSLVTEQSMWCPRCGHAEGSASWSTPEQREQHLSEARNYVRKRIGNAINRQARSFNAQQKPGSFIKMRMSYRPGRPELVMPAKASEVMTQDFRCEHCACRYTSIGAAFFCPACGKDSILANFWTSLETTKLTVRNITALRQTMEELSGKDVAADMSRQLLEEALGKVVACFQKFAEVRFLELKNAIDFEIRPNLFQNLAESDRIWRAAISTGYTDILTNNEYQRLVAYFQQRHVLEHQDGFIDQMYVDRTDDRRFKVGQRLVVTDDGVLDLIALCEKLAQGINSH